MNRAVQIEFREMGEGEGEGLSMKEMDSHQEKMSLLLP